MTHAVNKTLLEDGMRMSRLVLGALGFLWFGSFAQAESLKGLKGDFVTKVGQLELESVFDPLGSRLEELIQECGPGAAFGNFNISAQNMEQLDNIRCTFGTLALSGDGTIRLPFLWRVYGHLAISNSNIEAVEFPVLDEVWLKFTVTDNQQLRGIEAPHLGSINAKAVIQSNPNLDLLAWGSLGAVNGSLTIHDNPLLSELIFDALGGINGTAEVSGNPHLHSLDLRSLGSVNGQLSISQNLDLSELKLSSLGSVHGAISVTNNPNLSNCTLQSQLQRVQSTSVGAAINITANGPC